MTYTEVLNEFDKVGLKDKFKRGIWILCIARTFYNVDKYRWDIRPWRYGKASIDQMGSRLTGLGVLEKGLKLFYDTWICKGERFLRSTFFFLFFCPSFLFWWAFFLFLIWSIFICCSPCLFFLYSIYTIYKSFLQNPIVKTTLKNTF